MYLTDNPEDVFKGGDFDPKNPWVLKVMIAGLDLRFDPEFYDYDSIEELITAITNREESVYVYSPRPIGRDKIVGATSYTRFWWSRLGIT